MENERKTAVVEHQSSSGPQELYGQLDPAEVHGTTNKWDARGVQEMHVPATGTRREASELSALPIRHELGVGSNR